MIVLSALAGTSVCFACFSLAALVSKRRSFLYLGGESPLCLLRTKNTTNTNTTMASPLDKYMGKTQRKETPPWCLNL